MTSVSTVRVASVTGLPLPESDSSDGKAIITELSDELLDSLYHGHTL